MRSKSALALLFSLCFAPFALSAPAIVPAAPTPPMGWNSWNHFGHRVTDQTIRDTADAIVASGMRDAGYLYVNIDDTWEGTRDAPVNLHDLWEHKDLPTAQGTYHAEVPPHGVVMLRATHR